MHALARRTGTLLRVGEQMRKVVIIAIAATAVLSPSIAFGSSKTNLGPDERGQAASPLKNFTMSAVSRGKIDLPASLRDVLDQSRDARTLRRTDSKPNPAIAKDPFYAVATAPSEQTGGSQPDNAAIIDSAALSLGLLVATSSSGVGLSWDPSPTSPEYAIYRDGEQIGVSSNGAFVDSTPTPGSTHAYSVVSKPREFDTEEEANAAVAAPSYGALVTVPRANSITGLKREAKIATAAAALDPLYNDGRISYRAFIPEKQVFISTLEGWGCSNYSSFSGDNRSFTDRYQASARVANEAMFRWAEHKAFWTKTVAPTHALDANGKILATRVASGDGTSMSYENFTATSITVHQKIVGTNPFCVTGAIAGSQDTTAYSNGASKSSGNHRRMPNFETYYIFKKNGIYYTTVLHRDTYLSPRCLIGGVLPGCIKVY